MAYEIKDNSGSLFKNDRKEKETHPDYTGTIRIAGVDYWQSAWKKTDKNGNTYLSFSYKPKEPRGGYTGSYNGDPQTNSSGSFGIGPQEEAPF